jgi:hypothetical protein
MKKSVKTIMITTLAIGALLTGWSNENKVQASNQTNTKQETVKENHVQLLKQTRELAKQGKVKASKEFRIGSTPKEIVAKWGEADKSSDEYELKYSKRYITFYLDDQKNVGSLWTNDKSYQNVTYEEVKKAYGKPRMESYDKDNQTDSLLYPTGNGYEIAITFHLDKHGKRGTFKEIEVYRLSN